MCVFFRWQGSAPRKGGLLVRKGPSKAATGEEVAFKPRESALGLDRLAKQKREDQQASGAKAAPFSLSFEEDAGSSSMGPPTAIPKRKRPRPSASTLTEEQRPPAGRGREQPPGAKQFRRRQEPTPSEGTGLNERAERQAREREREREKRRAERYGSTRRSDRDSDRGHDSDRYRRSRSPRRSRDRDRDRDRRGSRDSVRRTRDRDGWTRGMGSSSSSSSGRGGGGSSSRRATGDGVGGDEAEWEAPIRLSSTAGHGGRDAASDDTRYTGRQSSARREPDGASSTPLPTPSRRPGTERRSRGRGGAALSPSPERGEGGGVNEGDLDRDFDRAYYDADEDGAQDAAPSSFLGDSQVFREREEEMKKRREQGVKRTGISARASALRQDQQAWETNRLLQSGVVQRESRSLEIDEETERRTILMVHNLKPPFLDGRVNFSTQREMVGTVKDPSSDIATMSRKGSALVRQRREMRERTKMRQRFWELGGSRMGDAMGVKDVNKAADAQGEAEAQEKLAAQGGGKSKEGGVEAEESGANFRKDSQYADHMKGKTEASSEFALSKSLQEQRRYLPVHSVRSELLEVVRDNQIVVIVGETGSGKTTQLTQYLMEEGFTEFGMVGCTQPRRVAAMSVAKRVSEEVGCELGSDVGYSIRFEDCTSKDTVIKYMTDGVLLRESLRDPDLENYSAIIMDEAHERSLHTDVLFGILKTVLRRRRDMKLIVTSATMDAQKFSDYYGDVPVFTIPGRTFPVETYHAKTQNEDYVDAAVKQVMAIHMSHPPGDILVFMTGQEDIETTCEVLAERMGELDGAPPLLLLPMYSALPSDLQARIFQRAERGARKCVVSTNIAETSLTVDGIKYVVDSGLCKLKVFNPKIGMDALVVTPVSQANANQRSGRAGRTGPGFCYRLYKDTTFSHDLLANQVPEIQRTNLSNVVLLLKSLGVQNLLEFSFMDPPPQENIMSSMYQLWVLGALDNTGALTPQGALMVEFPLDPTLSKMLVLSNELGCSAEVAIIVSMLSVPQVFYRPRDREAESDAAREKFFVPESDHLTLLNVYLQWKRNGYSASWCEKHFVHVKAVRKAREVREQLLDIMRTKKMQPQSCGTEWDIVRKCVCSAYFANAAQLKGIGEYVNMLTGIPCLLHPSSALYGLGYTPDYVVYHELVLTGKEYMHCVTAAEPEWLAELAPMFFSVKHSHESRLEKRRKVRAAASRCVCRCLCVCPSVSVCVCLLVPVSFAHSLTAHPLPRAHPHRRKRSRRPWRRSCWTRSGRSR